MAFWDHFTATLKESQVLILNPHYKTGLLLSGMNPVFKISKHFPQLFIYYNNDYIDNGTIHNMYEPHREKVTVLT